MALQTSTEYTAEGTVQYPDSDADPYSREEQLMGLHKSFYKHTHVSGRGLQIPPAGLTGDVVKRAWFYAN